MNDLMIKNNIFWPLLSNVIRGNSVSNTFGDVRKRADGTVKCHQGWDFSASVDTEVYAIADGKVEFVKNWGDYGNQICISFSFEAKAYYAFYAHLNKVYFKQGDSVNRNDLIALSGKTGNASNLPSKEDHLHFEIRTKATLGLGLKGRVDPFVIFGKCPLNGPIAG